MLLTGRSLFELKGGGFGCFQLLPPNSSLNNPPLQQHSPPFPPPFRAGSANPQPEQSPQQSSHHLLFELLSPTPRGQRLPAGKALPSALFSRLTPAALSQRQGLLRVPTGPQVVPTLRARGPGLGLRAAPGRAERSVGEVRGAGCGVRGAGRGKAGGCSGPRRGPAAAGEPGFGCSRPRRGPARPARSRSLGSHPTPRLLGKRKCLVEKNTVSSQPVSEPL